jgi:L-rhamnose mutarotase
MPIHAVRMKLKPGMADEYKRRQQKVWPHLSKVLRHLGNRWWNYMADLMEVEANNRPREWPLQSTFHFA